MKKEANTNKFYHFNVIHLSGEEISDSPGIKLIRKEDTEKFGGYNEDFAVGYGYEDFFFIKQAKAHGLKLHKLEHIDVINHGMGSPIEDCEVPINKEPCQTCKKLLRGKDPSGVYKDNLRFKWKKIH